MDDKLYTAEDLEIGKYYIKGYERAFKLLEKTSKEIESYPGVIYRVYKFEIMNIKTCAVYVEHVMLNTTWTCFVDVDTKRLEEEIKDHQVCIRNLTHVLTIDKK